MKIMNGQKAPMYMAHDIVRRMSSRLSMANLSTSDCSWA